MACASHQGLRLADLPVLQHSISRVALNVSTLQYARFSQQRPAVKASLKTAQTEKPWNVALRRAGEMTTALGLAGMLQLGAMQQAAVASEYNILQEPPPLVTHVVDDAGVLSRVSRSDVKRLLTDLEERTGFHIDVVTLRKLTLKSDVFEFADDVLETWYPTVEEGDKRAVLLLVTSQKEGAVSGGPTFLSTIGDDILEAVVSENLPVLATEERYNEAIYSTLKRLVARIDGQDDIPGPKFEEQKRVSNFKKKKETEEKRGQFTTVVGGLLVIAFVVPMVQYYAYVAKK
eukprot:TRINITY_DN243_c0_g1_i4.p1 TRINITY_DN243_c0_g1~~TRINITY_DN243_c0_g1_i4.p1  ORF type:complete len:309 (+),score=92.72 TRINITY_DN243_c0_g1_i4:62-928(+)